MKFLKFKKEHLPAESWISPKTKKGLPSKIHGKGFFATQPISKNEIVAIKAGHIIDKEVLEANKDIIQGSEIQISNGFFVAPLSNEELRASMIYFNHSCEPNIGVGGNILVVAMKDILDGEELVMDYAMEWADPSLTLVCNCQSKNCRKTITGNDWKNPALQKKYAGYFSWYIEQKIKNRTQASSS